MWHLHDIHELHGDLLTSISTVGLLIHDNRDSPNFMGYAGGSPNLITQSRRCLTRF